MLKHLANLYFDAFTNSDILRLRSFFSNDIKLQDWDVNANGIESVIHVYSNIFNSLSNISIKIVNLYEFNSLIIAELIISSNNIESISVVDFISYDEHQKICSIRAYKG
jgi:hypothetical protein